MAIPDVPLSCCCDWGTTLIGRAGALQWYLVGFTPSVAAYDLIDSNGNTLVNDQTGVGVLLLADDEGSIYCRSTSATDFKKFDDGLTEIWSHDYSSTSITEPFAAGFISGSNRHYDVDGSYNFYYCGRSTDTDSIARLVKLDSSGSQSWLAEVSGAFSGADESDYMFMSCAADLDGNVCAVGWRQKTVSSSVTKLDYIVYYFDSDGNEVWHDDIADDTTLNAANFRVVAHHVCFDDAGNAYVGFSHFAGGSPKTVPFLRKYDSSGGVTWTKSHSSSDSAVWNVLMSPDEKILLQLSRNPSGSFVRQYSGASHGTLDWTFTMTSAGVGGDISVDLSGDTYVTTINDTGSTRWRKINGATGTGGVSGSGLSLVEQPVTKPGKHPWFI